LLAAGGILIGLLLGGLIVAYFTTVGFHIGNVGYTGILLADTIHANLTLDATVNLSILTFIITLLAGLYPAWMASHMQPVEALHGGK
jgi:ABC-type lipoprotein release transport system permease subunit